MPVDWTVRRFDVIDSTNRWLADQAREGALHGLVAIAAEQSAGRGRLGRTWTAPAGSALLMSVFLDESALATAGWARTSWPMLSFAVANAAKRSTHDLGATTVSLKWPNDLLARRSDGTDRKLAGILGQAVPEGAVVGMGVNVRRPNEIPVEVAARGVWLDELAVDVSPEDLADRVLAALAVEIDDGPTHVRDAFADNCSTIGRDVRVELPGLPDLFGTAVGLSADGSLVVRDASNRDHVLSVGDVIHVR